MKLLDTTLRDGSYLINFGFTSLQTSLVVSSLDKAGIDFIEVGHGIGLNAGNAGNVHAKESDEDYMKAASDAIRHGKWGMFAIPGICNLDHLDTCIDYKIGFLRFGVSIDSYHRVLSFVEKAKAHGIIVCVNFMKSHARHPRVFEKAARQVVEWGADYIYLVDSTGNMTPSEVRQYCERIRDLPIGFHGHNNLGLAVANALAAVECGVEIVDCSIQGMGRSAGNTMLEAFVSLLQRDNKLSHVDLMSILDISEQYIRPIMPNQGISTLDVICGHAGFHSSYMEVIRRYATEYNIDPRLLILEVCKVSQSDAPDSLVQEKAMALGRCSANASVDMVNDMYKYYGCEQASI